MRVDASEWADRARMAAESVSDRFGHRLLGLPGTWIASVRDPSPFPPAPWHEWHYWWQAHYMDALVDAAGRELTAGPELPVPLVLAGRVLRTIRIRNYLRLTNSYYDDMAWLALAAGRATFLAQRVKGSELPGARRAIHILGGRLSRGQTQDLGGGTFWSTKRDFKNTPATAPSALFFVRNGERGRALHLADWLRKRLYDPEQGLYLDGVHPHPTGPVIERTIYSYNQGPILAVLLELGGERHLAQAAELIDAVARRLTEPFKLVSHVSKGQPIPSTSFPLRLHDGGDGGLFTGILVRYLCTAACWPGLPEDTRAKAATLVLDTAESLWAGRRRDPHPVFSSSIACPAGQSYPDGSTLELSTQLQAWTIFEAAYRLTNGFPRSPDGGCQTSGPSPNN